MPVFVRIARGFHAGFATPRRQALGWTALGVTGFLAALAGVIVFTGGNGDDSTPLAAEQTPTSTPASTSGPAASRTPRPPRAASPGVTAAQSVTPTVPRLPVQSTVVDPATATPASATAPPPTAEPTVEFVARDYCPGASGTFPPVPVAGFLYGATPGASVTLLFDGNAGVSSVILDDSSYVLRYDIGGSACANRVGAAVSVLYGGAAYSTGHVVGDRGAQSPVIFSTPVE